MVTVRTLTVAEARGREREGKKEEIGREGEREREREGEREEKGRKWEKRREKEDLKRECVLKIIPFRLAEMNKHCYSIILTRAYYKLH